MKWIIYIFGGLLGVIGIMYLWGSFLPVQHAANVSKTFKNSSDELWSVITDFGNLAAWRSGLESVEVIDERNWKEISGHDDEITFQATTWEPGKKLTTKIMNKDLPFGGTWDYDFETVPEGTRLTISENGEVYNPLFRFISKYIFGHDTTLKTYIADLEKKLGTP